MRREGNLRSPSRPKLLGPVKCTVVFATAGASMRSTADKSEMRGISVARTPLCAAYLMRQNSQKTPQRACSVTVSYKPPMFVTRIRLPACARGRDHSWSIQQGRQRASVLYPLGQGAMSAVAAHIIMYNIHAIPSPAKIKVSVYPVSCQESTASRECVNLSRFANRCGTMGATYSMRADSLG